MLVHETWLGVLDTRDGIPHLQGVVTNPDEAQILLMEVVHISES